jgi:hypothetical protein
MAKKIGKKKSVKRRADDDEPKFETAIQEFISHTDSLFSAVSEVLSTSLYEDEKKKSEAFLDFLKKKAKNRRGNSAHIPIEDVSRFYDLERALDLAHLARVNVPKSIFIMMVSNLDNHFKSLLKLIFEFRKDLIDKTEKNISLAEIFEIADMTDAKAYVLDREIDDILTSRYKFIDWLKTKLKLDLKQMDDHILDRLVEITERRNALVHSEGRVTRRYLDECRKRGLQFKEPKKVGDSFDMNPEYLTRSFMIIFVVGVILGHLVWRKLEHETKNLEEADAYLNTLIIALINRKMTGIAHSLSKFAVGLPTHGSESSRLIFLVNFALCQKFGSDPKQAIETMKKQDWSACDDNFKLADALIKDDFKTAAAIMVKIGPDKDMIVPYREWPIFREFRKTKLFINAYKKVYKRSYIVA